MKKSIVTIAASILVLVTALCLPCCILAGSFALCVKGTVVLENGEVGVPCTVHLMQVSSPFWGEKKTIEVERPMSVSSGKPFDDHFTIHGYSAEEFWLEIRCPGYETHNIAAFMAPSEYARGIDLGIVKLKKERR